MPKEIPNHYFTTEPKSKKNLGIIHTYLRGRSFEFLTATGVFSKRRVDLGTRLLIESMVLPENGYVLDVGCGYGAIGITAATSNPDLHIVMVDVNKRAVWLTKQNIQHNNVGNAEVRVGNLYEPVTEFTFNCILSNPPVSAGMDIVKGIISEAPTYLADEGNFEMVVRSKVGKKTLKASLEKTFGNVKILARKSGYRVFISEKE
jgi:16S rRNA G1207 methylase RsmC